MIFTTNLEVSGETAEKSGKWTRRRRVCSPLEKKNKSTGEMGFTEMRRLSYIAGPMVAVKMRDI